MALSKQDREEIVGIIKLTVNGKIDGLHEKVDNQQTNLAAFIEKLDPVIEAMGWLNTTKKVTTWVGGLAISVASIIALGKYFN